MRLLRLLSVAALFYLVGSVPAFFVLAVVHAFPVMLSLEAATGVGILSMTTPAILPVEDQYDFLAYLFSERE